MPYPASRMVSSGRIVLSTVIERLMVTRDQSRVLAIAIGSTECSLNASLRSQSCSTPQIKVGSYGQRKLYLAGKECSIFVEAH